jgi:ribosome modulation factor
MASSSNLTEAALGNFPRNYEAGIVLGSHETRSSVSTAFNQWWDNAWREARDLSDHLLESYTRIREQYLARNPDAFADQDAPSVQQIEAATSLWIDAGAMSGGSRNQIEFAEELARFFGPLLRGSRYLRVGFDAQVRDDRPLSFKVTTFGVEIWRLSLPTQSQGGHVYAGRILHFTKERDRHGELLRVDVADSGSNKHIRWRQKANRLGHIGATNGNRSFGFY